MSPLGKIILARAEALGGRRGPGVPAKPLSLAEMSALTGGQLTRAAINEWILGRVKNPTPKLLAVLASALGDYDYDKIPLLDDMRAAVGMPHEVASRTVDVADLAEDDIETLQVMADRLREKGREAAALAHAATDRATKFTAVANGLAENHHDATAPAGH